MGFKGKGEVLPEAHILSDWSVMAPCRIMPSVWPVLVSKLEAFVTCTPGAMAGVRCYRPHRTSTEYSGTKLKYRPLRYVFSILRILIIENFLFVA